MPEYLTTAWEQVDMQLATNGYYNVIQGDNCTEVYPNAKYAECARNDPIADFEQSFFGLAIIYFDAVVVHSEWAMYTGFGIGLILGVNSLISILAQYKSLSLTLTDGVIDDESRPAGIQNYREKQCRAIERLQKLQLQYTKWSELIKVYPLNSTVTFFGILLSTAVLQLVVTGTVLTFVIGSLAAVNEIYKLMHRISSFIVAWIAIAVVDSVVMQKWMVERVLTDNYRFKHPDIWILYTLVYTMLNLILGILYAVWRLVLLASFSIARLTRLDRPLFPTMQKLDQGHNAFISMVLMHYTIQRNTKSLRATLRDRTLEKDSGRNNAPGGGCLAVNNFQPAHATMATDATSPTTPGTGSELPSMAGYDSFNLEVPSRHVLLHPESTTRCPRADKSVQTTSSFMKWRSLGSDKSLIAAGEEKRPLIQATQVLRAKSFLRWSALQRREFLEKRELPEQSEELAVSTMIDALRGEAIPTERFRRACSDNIICLDNLPERKICDSFYGSVPKAPEGNCLLEQDGNALITASTSRSNVKDVPSLHNESPVAGPSCVDSNSSSHPVIIRQSYHSDNPPLGWTNLTVEPSLIKSPRQSFTTLGSHIPKECREAASPRHGDSIFHFRAKSSQESCQSRCNLKGVASYSFQNDSDGPDVGRLASEALFGGGLFGKRPGGERSYGIPELEASLSAPVAGGGQPQHPTVTAADGADFDSHTDPAGWRNLQWSFGREGSPVASATQLPGPNPAVFSSREFGV